MRWVEIKSFINRALREGSELRCFESEGFWESGEEAVFRSICYLYNKGNKGEFDVAMRIAQEAVDRKYTFSEERGILFKHLQGDLLSELKRYRDAIGVYDELLRLEESDVAYANRALAKLDLGDVDDAMQDYRSAVKLNAGVPPKFDPPAMREWFGLWGEQRCLA